MEKKSRESVKAICDALDRLYGNRLAAWRALFDLNGDMQVDFKEFCNGIASLREKANLRVTSVVEDYRALDRNGDGFIYFKDLAPYGSALLDSFREWVQRNFDDPVEMFMDFDSARTGNLFRDNFTAECDARGFTGLDFEVCQTEDGLLDNEGEPGLHTVGQKDLKYIFDGLDFNGNGVLQVEEVIFLERDHHERKVLLAGWGNKNAMEEAIRWLKSDRKTTEQNSGPQALGRWNHIPLEQPSELEVWKKKLEWQRLQQAYNRRCAANLRSFLRRKHRSVVRAWRTALNPEGRPCVSRAQLLQYCRSREYDGDAKAAYQGLDQEGNGYVLLEDLDRLAADDLACFREQLLIHFGSLEEASRALRTQGGIQRVRAKMDFRSFKQMLLETMKLKEGDPRSQSLKFVRSRCLFEALDGDGLGFIQLPRDILYLGQQQYMPCAGVEADPKAADLLLEALLSRYGSYIAAWRQLLDSDNSNEVSWNEFCVACQEIGFATNLAGCWRHLDVDVSGSISLKEIDPASHNVLVSFRNWATKTFGSVMAAFAVLDRDASGSMNCQEFRKASKFFGWEGDATSLFTALAPVRRPGRDDSEACMTVTKQDLEFLDHWLDLESAVLHLPEELPPEEFLLGSPLARTRGISRSATANSLRRPSSAASRRNTCGGRGSDLLDPRKLVDEVLREAGRPRPSVKPMRKASGPRPSSATVARRGRSGGLAAPPTAQRDTVAAHSPLLLRGSASVADLLSSSHKPLAAHKATMPSKSGSAKLRKASSPSRQHRDELLEKAYSPPRSRSPSPSRSATCLTGSGTIARSLSASAPASSRSKSTRTARRHGACESCEASLEGGVAPGILGTIQLRSLRCRCLQAVAPELLTSV
eukprot:TRINITY_DN87598_c0_g1_i2.p1 TRINITY_DN87598_c0_g1~~TRINITY_DN87598_c0_g1_i2.p1  ORF type:complete len:883 (+),score=155.79 TRINITY_DN87598_c0_g1_i2:34-2649(+)